MLLPAGQGLSEQWCCRQLPAWASCHGLATAAWGLLRGGLAGRELKAALLGEPSLGFCAPGGLLAERRASRVCWFSVKQKCCCT